MGKTITFGIIFLVTFVFFVCCKTQNTSTPKEYMYFSKVNPDTYTKDSIYIHGILLEMVVNNIQPFKPKSFDINTQVFLDTLIYSPDSKRLAIWVITKNSNSKLLYPKDKDGYYYNGNCMYASRSDSSNVWRIHEYGFYGIDFSKSYKVVRDELSLYSFHYRSTFKRTDSIPTYNINDIRFWKEITWEESILSTPSH